MKKLIYLFLVLTFVSCGKENYYEEFYGNGNIKLKIEINENKIRNGKFIEYYQDGKIKATGKYINGEVEDSTFLYYENGKLRESGFWKRGYRKGWFITYREHGQIMKRSMICILILIEKNIIKWYLAIFLLTVRIIKDNKGKVK